MKRLGPLLLRGLGLLLLLLALLVAATKAPDRSPESLVARWAAPPSEFVEVVGQLVHLRDQGPRHDAQPIVLIHGTASSLHSWEGWVQALSATRRVISFDLPGMGLTGPSASGDYSAEADLAFVQALLRQLKLPPVVLVGHEIGGQIAWQLGLRDPSRVAALVLVDPAGPALAPELVPALYALVSTPVLSGASRFLLPRRLVEHHLQSLWGNAGRLRSEQVERSFELLLREGNREALSQRLAQRRPAADIDRLGELRQPTLVLWGGRDRWLPAASGEVFARAIAASRFERFETLGHLPHEEDAKATAAVLTVFLQSLKP